MVDFIVMKKEDQEGKLIELVNNLHCEVYEVVVDGMTVFNCTNYQQAEHEYNMECM
jgi:hypothetical protein